MTRTATFLATCCLAAALAACGGDDDGSPVDLPEDPSAPLGAELEGPDFPAGTTVRVVAAPPADAFVSEAAAPFENETEVRVESRVVDAESAAAAACSGKAQVVALPAPAGGQLPCGGGEVVAHEAVAIAAHPDAELGCLAPAQLRRLWREGSPVNDLSELDAALPGGHLELVGPPPDRPAVDLFAERALDGAPLRTYRAVEDGPVLAELVSENPRALGFYNYSRIDEAAPGQVELAALESDGECVAPTRESIQSGRYPLARDIYLFGPRGDSAAAAFARWAVENRRRAGLTASMLVAAGDQRDALE